MERFPVALLASATLWIACLDVGLAEDTSPPPKAADEVSAPAPSPADELVCHYEKPTGSRMRVRICRTQAQIQADEEEKQRALDEVRARGNQRNGSGG